MTCILFQCWLHLFLTPYIVHRRDILAESVVKTTFEESIKRHLMNRTDTLQQQLDPLILFPLEFDFRKQVYKWERAIFFITEICRLETNSKLNIWLENLPSSNTIFKSFI